MLHRSSGSREFIATAAAMETLISCISGVGIGFASFYFFSRKRDKRESLQPPSVTKRYTGTCLPSVTSCASIINSCCLAFFKVEDGHLMFHLHLYIQTVNK